MKELDAPSMNGKAGGLDIVNVLQLRGKMFEMLQKTPQSQTGVFTLPAGHTGDGENTHKGDQLIYVIDGKATARVSGKEQELKAGDLLMIPAGARTAYALAVIHSSGLRFLLLRSRDFLSIVVKGALVESVQAHLAIQGLSVHPTLRRSEANFPLA